MRRARIGDLDQRFVIERPVDTPDDIGGVVRAWDVVDVVWGRLQPASGTHGLIAAHEASTLTHRIMIRWRPDVTGAMRVRLGERVFTIHAAIDWDTRRRFMLLQCEEIA